MSRKEILEHAKNLVILIGKRPLLLAVAAIFGAIALSGIEMVFAAVAQRLVLSLDSGHGAAGGIVSTWLDRFNLGLTHLSLLLIAIGLVRGTLTGFLSFAAFSSQHLFLARLRQVLIHNSLKPSEESWQEIPKNFSFLSTDVFPKAAGFICHIALGVPQALMVICLAAYLVYADWMIASFAFAGIIAIAFCVRKISLVVSRKAKHGLGQSEKFFYHLERIYRNMFLIKIFRTDQREFHSLTQENLELAQNNISTYRDYAISGALPQILGITLLGSLCVIASQFSRNGVTSLILIFYLLMRIIQLLSAQAWTVNEVISGLPKFKIAYLYFLETLAKTRDNGTFQPITRLAIFGAKLQNPSSMPGGSQRAPLLAAPIPSVDIRGLGYRYKNTKAQVLSGLTLHISPGEQLGIIGPSGTGKSTLLSLIFGILMPDEGEILINNEPATKYLEKHPHSIGYAGSEPFLFEGSIRENLEYGSDRVYSQSDFEDIFRRTRLSKTFVHSGKDLNRTVTANGEGLSAGEKQRLSLARALLRNPSLLVLDEFTSNLDQETERDIALTLQELKGSCTLIIVSHRPGALIHADRIFDLSKKRFVVTHKAVV